MGQRSVTQGLVSRIAIGVFGLLTIAMVLLAIFDDRGALAMRAQRQKRDALQTEITGAEKQNDEYRTEIEALRSDPSAVERRAREQLNMVKPGEIILELPKSQTPRQQ